MLKRIFHLLNIKPNEAGLVKLLFMVQFLLGIATSFLYTCSLTLFLSYFSIRMLPWVFITSAVLIVLFNRAYIYFEHKYAPPKLLNSVIFFSIVSTFLFWIVIEVFNRPWLILMLAAWNSLIYTLVGYAYWGLSSQLFNVRESKRVFSIVGAGDIPAKMLGYLSVSILVHITGVVNLLWISVSSLIIASIVMRKLGIEASHDSGQRHSKIDSSGNIKLSITGKIIRIFHSKLIFYISMVSLLAYIIFSFVDFTFLSNIKVKYKQEHELASFIAVFFAGGRILAILIKVLLSSRMISKIGLLNSLLITPVLLLMINSIVILSNGTLSTDLYLFGSMVLLIEILRSIVQEPVFFILFQPLQPHDRLKGHIIAKGYTLPVALIAVGSFLIFYLNINIDISILFLSKILTVFLLLWVGFVFLIKKEYLQTLIHSLKKGYFTGAEMFLNNDTVSNFLLKKVESDNPREVINGLNLLERSSYQEITTLFISLLHHHRSLKVKEYVVMRMIQNKMISALPLISKKLNDPESRFPLLYRAWFYLGHETIEEWVSTMNTLNTAEKKEALKGLIMKDDPGINRIVNDELQNLLNGNVKEDLILICDMLMESSGSHFSSILESLLQHPEHSVYQKAMDTTSRLKIYSLFEELFKIAAVHKAYYSFQRALVNYGDEIYDPVYWTDKEMDPTMKIHTFRAAGKIKGVKSDNYLLLNFSTEKDKELIIRSLWEKRADVSNKRYVVEQWITIQLDQMNRKFHSFMDLHALKSAQILEKALMSEIQQDLESVLKGCALIFDREQIDRFIEVYLLEIPSKLANAIELLEMSLPKKYFHHICHFIDIKQDLEKKQFILHHKPGKDIQNLLNEIVNNAVVGYSIWSRSVALYISPKLLRKEEAIDLADKSRYGDEMLIRETKNYVLNVLKQDF